MYQDQSYNVSNVVVKAKEREGDRATILEIAHKSLTDLNEIILDPSTQSVNLTAAILNSDNSITIENIILNHDRAAASNNSAITSHSVSWKHTVPQTVEDLFANLANNLTVYVTAEDGPVDSVAITGIAIGDPSLETLLKSQNQATSSSVVDLYFDDIDDDE